MCSHAEAFKCSRIVSPVLLSALSELTQEAIAGETAMCSEQYSRAVEDLVAQSMSRQESLAGTGGGD